MPIYFDRSEPFAFTRKQGFHGVVYEPKDKRVLRAAELIREAEEYIDKIQDAQGHLDGDGLAPHALRIEQEISELIRKLRNLRA